MNKITFSRFVKLLTKQPFLVWNEIDFSTNLENDNENNQFELPNFWDDIASPSHTMSEIQRKSFFFIEKEFNKKIQSSFSNVYFIKSKSLDDRVKETAKALKKNYEVIVNPLFNLEYKNYQVYASPKLFFPKLKKFSELKISGSNRRKDLLKFFFDFHILEKLGYEIDNVSLFNLATKHYLKHEIDFFETYKINLTKSPKATPKAIKDKLEFARMQLYKTGNITSKKKNSLNKTIIDIIIKPNIPNIFGSKIFFYFETIEFYLDEIIKIKSQFDDESNKLQDQKELLAYPSNKDNSIFDSEKEFLEILRLKAPNYYGFNLKLISKKDIIDKISLQELASDSKVLEQILSAQKPIINDDEFIEMIISKIMNNHIVWYDFEAFSIPIAPLEYFLPFQQVVFQVSIVKTNKMVEIEKHNHVSDPYNFNAQDFIKIINLIYDQDADYYVVYNKSYENTRLKEMLIYLKKIDHPLSDEIENKIEIIVEQTIDLADVFACHSKHKTAPILIPELKGKYSIKLVEKYINKHLKYDQMIKYKIKPYENLDVKNGLMAMEMANYRALDIIGDHEWEIKKASLKEYCENDVRAMIMVFFLVKLLKEEKDYGLNLRK